MLAEARRQLGRMPRVHLETAIGQFGGTIALISNEIDAALEAAPQCAAAARPGPPGRPGGADRTPVLAVRAAGRGGRPWRLRRSADRAGTVRPQAVAHAERVGGRGRHPGPGRGRPGPGERADHGARRADRRRGRTRSRPAGARPAGRGRARRRHDPGVLPRRPGRADRVRNRPPPDHGLRRPDRADPDAGDRPRCRGGLLRLPRPARAGPAAYVHRGLADAGRLGTRAGRLVLPRVQPAHGARPDGA